MSGKENSRLKQMRSHLKQKYMLPESCFSVKKKGFQRNRIVTFKGRVKHFMRTFHTAGVFHSVDFKRT